MNILHFIGWDINSESGHLEEVSSKERSFFEERLSSVLDNWVLLSTCHRVEIYSTDKIPEFDELKPYRSLSGADAINHLFRVASGIESVSVGEQEILHQVKVAFEDSLESGRSSKLLSLIFRKAISVGKTAREETGISRGKTSIPAHIGQILSSLEPKRKRVAVVGSGKLAGDLVKYAGLCEPLSLRIYARNRDALLSIMNRYNVEVVNNIDTEGILRDNDVVITATASKKPIFTADYGFQDRILIDLGMPPNVDRANMRCRVIPLSEIEPLLRKNSEKKASLVPMVEGIIEREVKSLESKLLESEAEELIKLIFNNARDLKTREVRTASEMLYRGNDTENVLNNMADSLINKILAPQTLTIKKLLKTDNDDGFREALNSFYKALKKAQEDSSKGSAADHQAGRGRRGQILQ